MHCPFCGQNESKVLDSRITDGGYMIRRRRQCSKCMKRFSTQETISLCVVKRSGNVESFSKRKIVDGVKRAMQGREVDDDTLYALAIDVERTIREKYTSQVDSYDIGLAILEPLKKLDIVAYMRFASVYKGFDSLKDFETEISLLKKSSKSKFKK